MTHVRRHEEYVAFLDLHVIDPAAVRNLQQHVALELIEELLHGIIVKVDALIGAADDHHGHLGLDIEQLLVADRRFEQVLVLVDPTLEIESLEARVVQHFVCSYSAATACGSLGSLRPHDWNASRVAVFSASVSSTSGRRTGPPTWPSSSCQYF